MTETRWLSASEQRAWRAYLEASNLLFDALERQLQRDSGIPHGYYEILVRLSEADDRSMRMSELAERTRSSRSRLSHAVARLEERGWIERLDCDTDRRGQVAHLTDVGFAALAAAAPGHVSTVRADVIDRLTPAQIGQLEVIGRAIVDGLEAAPPREQRMSTDDVDPYALRPGTFVASVGCVFDPVVPDGLDTVVTGRLEVDQRHQTPWGVVHGGVWTTVVESAASIGACAVVADRGQFAVGVDNLTDFLRPVRSGRIDVIAHPAQIGRSLQLWQVELTDAAGKTVARGRVRLANQPWPA